MIPLWVISLLDTESVEEFLYESDHFIYINGKVIHGEWVVSISVKAIPYFAWGCNNLYTGISGPFHNVIRYYLTVVLNQLTEYEADTTKVFEELKRYAKSN